jgi:hypothetical protein
VIKIEIQCEKTEEGRKIAKRKKILAEDYAKNRKKR